MKSGQTIILIILVAIIFFCGLFVGKRMTEPVVEYRSDTTYIEPDTASIVAKARHGWLEYDYNEFVRKFGNTYRDTNLTLDSIKWNIRDSIRYIDIPFMEVDTVFEFSRKDSVKKWEFGAKLDLHAESWWHPLYIMKFDAVLRDVRVITVTPQYISSWRWYDNFYIGIGLNMDMKPGLQAGYGFSVGDIFRGKK